MKKVLFALLILYFILPVTSSQEDAKPYDWVVWLNATTYVQEWQTAFEDILAVMNDGDHVLLCLPGARTHFAVNKDKSQLEKVVSFVRSRLESSPFRQKHLINEMSNAANSISAQFGQVFESSRSSDDPGGAEPLITQYLHQRKDLINLYDEGNKLFWQELEQNLVPPSKRLLVLTQAFNVPVMTREAYDGMRKNHKLNKWSLELQDLAPWEQTKVTAETLADNLHKHGIRVDSVYIKNMGISIRTSQELSKAFTNRLTILTKKTGGINQNLPKKTGKLAASLKR